MFNLLQKPKFNLIETLSFSFNKISEISSLAFNGLNDLKRLDLSHNEINKLDLRVWPGLLVLNISFNHLSTLSSVKCPTLENLDISHNEMKNLVLSEETINLKHLNISSNKIQTLPGEQILKLALFSLQIYGCVLVSKDQYPNYNRIIQVYNPIGINFTAVQKQQTY